MTGYHSAYRPTILRQMGQDQGTQGVRVPGTVFASYGSTSPALIALEMGSVLAVTSAAAWVGIRTGMKEKQNKTLKAAGWVGGVGSALIGVLFLASKLGVVPGLPTRMVI